MKFIDALQIKLWQKANQINNSFINSVLAIYKEEYKTHFLDIGVFDRIASDLLRACIEDAPLFQYLINKDSKEKYLSLYGNDFRYALSSFETKARDLVKYTKDEVSVINSINPIYPRNLLDDELRSLPFLFYHGQNIDLKNKIILTIIGSRKISLYGERVIENFVKNLKYYPVVIVSGFAKGIDTIAHKSAINNELPTLAILPSSIDKLYPKNFELKKLISDKGALLFEYLPNTEVRKHHFLQRNYLLSRIADLILVVEAGEKSGAMITASYAAEQNKTIFAVPGNIDARQSLGSNKLIEEGARICLSAESLIDEMKSYALELGIEFKKKLTLKSGNVKSLIMNNSKNIIKNDLESKVCALLEVEALGSEEIFNAFKSQISLPELTILLTKLEIQGKILRNNGRYILTK